MTVTQPLNLPKRTLEKRFKELLADCHTGKRGKRYAKGSRAKYQFKGQPNLQGMKKALKVYDHIKANPEIKLWEVGRSFPVQNGT